MEKEKKKQPSLKATVLCILALTLGGAAFLSSGIIDPTAGAVTYIKMSPENMLPVIVKGDGEDTTIKPDGTVTVHTDSAVGMGVSYIKSEGFGDNNQYQLHEAGGIIYFKSEGQETIALDIEGGDLSTAAAAPNGKSFLIAADGDLYVFNISRDKVKNYIKVEEDVDAYYYTINNDFVIQKGTSLIYCSGGYKHTIETDALNLTVAMDSGALYYIQKEENTLVRFQVGGTKDKSGAVPLDTNVSDMIYAGNDTIFYIKDGLVYKGEGTAVTNLEIKGESFYHPEIQENNHDR